jgi:hypothetical protein
VSALACTYDDTTSRILLSATALGSAADVALFEWSSDQIHWRQVRGGSAVTVASGSASVYDYEFTPGVANYYRVSGVDLAAPTFVAAGTAATANNASVSPGIPAGYAEGDLLVIWASIRNSGAGSIVAPANWIVMLQADNIALLGMRATASESAPTVTISGGAASADVIAQMACFRNVELAPAATAFQLNPSAQNIAYPGLAGVQSTWALALLLGWKADDWTSVAAISGATEIGETVAIAGTDAGMVWDYLLTPTSAAVAPGSFVVTGGAAAISYGASVALRRADYVTRASASVTPMMSAVWLKVLSAPYLNRSVVLTGWAETTRISRVGFYSVVGKRDAQAATDVHSPRTVTINLWADNDAEVAALDLVLSMGSTTLLHIPPVVALKSMYVGVGNYSWMKPASLSHRARFEIPLTEVSMPSLAIVGSNVTWATLITNYTDWSAVAAANATWTSVLALSGTPADALVGV